MPERARVLIVSDEMEVGGSQRQIAHLLSRLDRRRWQPELLYFRSRSFLADQIEASGIPVHELPKRGRVDVRFVWRLRELLRAGHYDVVHCFSVTAETWVRAILPWVPPLAFIASVRGLYLGYSPWRWRRKRWIVHRADAVIANSRAGARMTSERTGLPPERIAVIPNGVPMPTPISASERALGRAELSIPAGRVCGLFAGRLVAAKNIPLLLEALARIAPPQRPFVLLAGGGPLADALAARAQQLRLHNDLRFLGEREDARALMQWVDFVVLPSRDEGLSNVLIEAMAAGCPPLASAVGGSPELIDDGRTGLLFPSDDVDALSERLALLASDAPLRERLGAAARVQAEQNYTLNGLVRRTEGIYLRAMHAQ